YNRALEFLPKAHPEFPGDAELAEMERLAQEGLEKADRAQHLMNQGQELCGQHHFDEGVKLLEQAFHIDEHNAVTRSVLCNALLEQARLFVDTDWKVAEELTLRALDLNPGHPQAKSMRTLVQDRKREQFVNECLSQARRLQAAGDLVSALAKIEEGLLAYPNEFRLQQIRETLQREMAESQQRQERRQDMEELRRLQKQAESGADPSLTAAFGKRAQTLAGKYPHDDQFESLAKEAAARTALFDVQQSALRTGESRGPAIANATRLFSPGSVAGNLAEAAAPAPEPPTGQPSKETFRIVPKPTPVGPAAQPPKPKRPSVLNRALAWSRDLGKRIHAPDLNFSPRVLGAVGGVLVLLIILAVTIPKIISPSKPKLPRGAVKVPVHIVTSPAGANLLINGEMRGSSEVNLDLAPDSYTITAQLDGYQPVSNTLEVRNGSPVSLEIKLLPLSLALRVLTDVVGGKLWLDDQPSGDLNEGQLSVSNVAPGRHKVRFSNDKGQATFQFEAAQGVAPTLADKIAAQGLHAVVVGGYGPGLKVYSSFGPAQLSLDGKPAGDVGPAGIELKDVAPGAHQLAAVQGNDRHVVDVEVGPVPSLNVFLQSDQNIGTLLVITAEDKVKVFLDGKPQKRLTEGGQLRIANLEPRQYAIRVAKDGFQDSPEQKIDVRKGEQARLKFVLQPIVRAVAFSISGGIPGTVVTLDHAAIGTIQSDGSFRYSSVQPGDHVIELRKDRYKPRQIQKHFAVGTPVALVAAETVLEPMPGELHVTFTPADADVTLTGNGQPPAKLKNGTSISLPPGSYSVTARTSDGLVRSSVVQVASGESRNLDLALAPGGMSNWEQPEAWTQERDYFVHRGGNFVLYKTSPTAGTFSFSALLQKGHRLQWVLHYTDEKNYLLFSMDENFFYRSVVVNGQPTETAQFPHKTEKKQFRTLQVRVTGNEVVNEIREGNSWVPLDTWSQQGADLSAGKFGFYIPGKDQVALSNFRHYAELKPQ
ncbi:MAG TPA: PEGA domain-containing protein, partial [Terriglobales bacterium]|nr:PEGA domain-containing protein [Terriglobales bacterium]